MRTPTRTLEKRRAGWIAILAGAITAVALFPVGGVSVIDGDQEIFVKTLIGWVYRVPDALGSEAMAFVLPIIEGILAGLGAWALMELLRKPTGRESNVAITVFGVSIVLGIGLIVFLATQPSQYRHVFV